jgi:protein N-terminal glutamine amidohydrolase
VAEPGIRYCPFYCEENVWHLCANPRLVGTDRRVVIVSNHGHHVAVWRQRAAYDAAEPVVWDYHVVLLSRAAGTWRVWDLDSALGLEVPLARWLRESFQISLTPKPLRPMFRCVDADVFREVFASDRRHMRRPDGTEVGPAPPWPCIGHGHNLDRFIDMQDVGMPGERLDFDAFCRRFGLS